ncbi:MAG: trigger factor [Holosporales bacterium]|jgi:trigger factor|nr:trigger factor [Holosporales bacterium]
MQIKDQSVEGFHHHYTLLISETEIAEKIETRLRQIATQTRIAGFRPGKAPLSVVKRLYAPSVRSEETQKLVSESLKTLIQEKNVRLAKDPELKVLPEGKEGLTLSVDLSVLPEVTAPEDFTDLKVTRLVPQVGQKDVDSYLETLRKEGRGWKDAPAKHKAKVGDHLVLDLVTRLSLKGAKEEKTKDLAFVLGERRYAQKFEERFLGASAGDSLSFPTEFPKRFADKRLAGKKAQCTAYVTKVSVPVPLRSLDDLVKQTQSASLEALREEAKKTLEEKYQRISYINTKKTILDILSERHSFAIPPDMEAAEFANIWRDFEKEQGEKLDKLPKKQQEKLQTKYKKIANRRVRLGLLVAEIGKVLKIDVTTQELEACVANMAANDPQRAEFLYRYYTKNRQALAALRAEIFEEKVIGEILKRATLSEKPTSLQEIDKIALEEGDILPEEKVS